MIIKHNIRVYDICWLNYAQGGVIGTFYEPESKEELTELCRSLYKEGKLFDLIGHTSNIYFLPNYSVDIMVSTRKVKQIVYSQDYIIADCGANVKALAHAMVNEGVKGFEGLMDLPGTVGAAVYGNASCFGCSINDLLVDFEILLPDGEIVTMKREDLKLAKRSTIFKRGEMHGVILSVRLKKEQGDATLLKELATQNHERRKQTQPGPKDNLGSIFANSGSPRLRYKLAYLLLKPIQLINKFLYADRDKRKKANRGILFAFMGVKQLEPYVYGWNRFIWKDDSSHEKFWDYVECHKKLFTASDFEIEIKGNRKK